MARRRWFARDVVASMGRLCLIILAIGGCGVSVVDSAAMEPSVEVPCGEEGGCYRPLSDVIWGFLVTFLALTVSLWGSWKHTTSDIKTMGSMILFGVCAPPFDLGFIVQMSLGCVSLLWNCHKMEYPDARITSSSWLKFLCLSLFPWSKTPSRILASYVIVVYVLKESPLFQKAWSWRSLNDVMDEFEAMVVGKNGARVIRNDQYVREELSEKGIGLLVWKDVIYRAKDPKRLPMYDELKYLRGNFEFAVIAIAIQAFGYIYAVGFRDAKNLRNLLLKLLD